MERGAEVRSGGTGPADDELPRIEARPFFCGEPVDVAVAVGRQDENALRCENPVQLGAPPGLGLLGEMREDGDRRDGPEAAVRIRQRRREAVPLEAREEKVVTAPANRLGIAVAAVQVVTPAPVPDHAPAAAPEVEQPAGRPVSLERLADGLGGQPAALEEPARVSRPRDPDPQPRRRQVVRDPRVGTERLERLVDPERRPQEQAQKARLNGRLCSNSSISEFAAQLTSEMITTAPT
jgi:hypothetical protein